MVSWSSLEKHSFPQSKMGFETSYYLDTFISFENFVSILILFQLKNGELYV